MNKTNKITVCVEGKNIKVEVGTYTLRTLIIKKLNGMAAFKESKHQYKILTISKRKNVREKLALEGKSKEEINDICNCFNCFKWNIFAKRTKIDYIEGNIQFCHFLAKKYYTSYLTLKEAKAAQKKAEDELDEYIGTSKKDGVYDLLLSALQKYSDRDYTGSADALLDIDSKKLTTKNMKAIHKDLTAKVYPSAGTGLYSKGKNAYWAKDYKTAISYLKKAIKVSDTNRYAYDYLAKAYEGASDQKNAKKTYQTIIEKFPGTSQAINAKSRIDAKGNKSAKRL